MRNSSDIFCLREPKDGDSSGTQLFSVNGQCSLKGSGRKRSLHSTSSSFEYGTPLSKTASELAKVLEGNNEFDEEVDREIEEELANLNFGEQISGTDQFFESSVGDSPVDEAKMNSPKKIPNKKNGPVFNRLNKRKDDEVVKQSAMARNPLTGAGVETELLRKTRKGAARLSKGIY